MRSQWPDLIGLSGQEFLASGEHWSIRHADILEDQRSTRLALLLDLQRGDYVVSARLLFPSETYVEHAHQKTQWILDSLKGLIEGGKLSENGIYVIA